VTVTAKRTYLDAEAFRAALNAFTPAQLIRLRKQSAFLALGSGFAGDDLLSEAIVRTLGEGGRNCPADVPIAAYLYNAMRSIADGEREKWEREAPSGDSLDEATPIAAHPDPAPGPEQIALGRIEFSRVIPRIEALFADDPKAMAVIIGDMEGATPDEIRELEPMDDKEFVAARKRVRRTIAREFGERKAHEQ
jgi:hypothetical protein